MTHSASQANYILRSRWLAKDAHHGAKREGGPVAIRIERSAEGGQRKLGHFTVAAVVAFQRPLRLHAAASARSAPDP